MTLPNLTPESEISTAKAARLLMMTPEPVRQLEKEGWLSKVDRGRWVVRDLVSGYTRFLSDLGASHSHSLTWI